MPSGRASSSPSRAWLARFSFGIALVAYALAMAVWEHKVLRLDGAPAAAALLASTKEAFVAGGRSISPGDDDGGAANSTAAAGAGVENVALSHRPAHVILQNPRLPDWIKRYASWHAVQRKRYIDFKRGNSTETSVSDIKFLISRCLASDHCGGASDRLQDMPYNMKVANETNRVLLVRWEKPAALENFLVPPANGIDWTIDDELLAWMREDDDNGNFNLKGKESDDKKRFVSTIRRDSAAPIFRQYEINEVGHKIYHEIFRLTFAPSRQLADRVHETMELLGLAPGRFSSVHLRVKYPVRGVDERSFTFEKHRHQIVEWATNAVNCAAELHPNSTIYVSSDSNDTVGYLLEESHFARHYIDATVHKKHPLVVKLVARDYSNGNEHVAFSDNVEADGFMSVFEDMMIMGMGKCVAHGVGGYGRLAAALSGGECVMAHRGRRSRTCSNALAKTQDKDKI